MTDGVDQTARDGLTEIRRIIDRDMVRKDVYEAQQGTRDARVAENEKDILATDARLDKAEERAAAGRRLILTSLVLPIVVAIILIYVQTQLGAK